MASGNVNLGRGVWKPAPSTPDLTGKSLMFQNLQNNKIKVMGTVAASEPANDDGALRCGPLGGPTSATSLEAMFPGQGFAYIWFWSDDGGELSFWHD